MLTDVRLIFAEVSKDYPTMSKCIILDADIATEKSFQKATMKIIDWS